MLYSRLRPIELTNIEPTLRGKLPSLRFRPILRSFAVKSIIQLFLTPIVSFLFRSTADKTKQTVPIII